MVSHLSNYFAALAVFICCLALLIASPLAWWGMTLWLRNFVYHIFISGWMFLTAGGLAILIALATVSFHAVRAALANPVKSLRAE